MCSSTIITQLQPSLPPKKYCLDLSRLASLQISVCSPRPLPSFHKPFLQTLQGSQAAKTTCECQQAVDFIWNNLLKATWFQPEHVSRQDKPNLQIKVNSCTWNFRPKTHSAMQIKILLSFPTVLSKSDIIELSYNSTGLSLGVGLLQFSNINIFFPLVVQP